MNAHSRFSGKIRRMRASASPGNALKSAPSVTSTIPMMVVRLPSGADLDPAFLYEQSVPKYKDHPTVADEDSKVVRLV